MNRVLFRARAPVRSHDSAVVADARRRRISNAAWPHSLRRVRPGIIPWTTSRTRYYRASACRQPGVLARVAGAQRFARSHM
jgi:hypothetical protein